MFEKTKTLFPTHLDSLFVWSYIFMWITNVTYLQFIMFTHFILHFLTRKEKHGKLKGITTGMKIKIFQVTLIIKADQSLIGAMENQKGKQKVNFSITCTVELIWNELLKLKLMCFLLAYSHWWAYDCINSGKIRRESFCEDFDDPEPIFCARYGYRSSTWSFCDRQGSSFENSTSGFDHRRERQHSSWANRSRTRKWTRASDSESASDFEYDDDINSRCLGLLSDRTILGLPTTGPLKIEDVKNA